MDLRRSRSTWLVLSCVALGVIRPRLLRQVWPEPSRLLNVSYDPTRELYKEFNPAFAKHWKEKTGRDGYVGCRTAARASRPGA